VKPEQEYSIRGVAEVLTWDNHSIAVRNAEIKPDSVYAQDYFTRIPLSFSHEEINKIQEHNFPGKLGKGIVWGSLIGAAALTAVVVPNIDYNSQDVLAIPGAMFLGSLGGAIIGAVASTAINDVYSFTPPSDKPDRTARQDANISRDSALSIPSRTSEAIRRSFQTNYPNGYSVGMGFGIGTLEHRAEVQPKDYPQGYQLDNRHSIPKGLKLEMAKWFGNHLSTNVLAYFILSSSWETVEFQQDFFMYNLYFTGQWCLGRQRGLFIKSGAGYSLIRDNIDQSGQGEVYDEIKSGPSLIGELGYHFNPKPRIHMLLSTEVYNTYYDSGKSVLCYGLSFCFYLNFYKGFRFNRDRET
jgi:hypothetical protein